MLFFETIHDNYPWELLLDADPAKELVKEYLNKAGNAGQQRWMDRKRSWGSMSSIFLRRRRRNSLISR